MTSEHVFKKRCVVKKLDFENCIVTNIRSKTRGRRKLRARVTREVETFDEEEKIQTTGGSPTKSPVLTQRRRQVPAKIGSPVLIGKQHKRHKSPALNKRKKIDRGESPVSTRGATPSQNSPVFKLGNFKLLSQRMNLSIEFMSEEKFSSPKSGNSRKTEDSSQTSRQNLEISSVDSENVKGKSPGDYSVEMKSQSSVDDIKESSSTSEEVCTKLYDFVEPVRRSYKKNSLLGRLQKVLRKQSSEKLLWLHQKQKPGGSSLKKLAVINFWSSEFRFILKCQSLGPDLEIHYLFVDRRWVPNVKNVKEGSVLQLHPPWQKLCFGKPLTTVLLNVICLEILGDMNPPDSENVKLQTVSPSQFENDTKTFIDSLLSSKITGYMY